MYNLVIKYLFSPSCGGGVGGGEATFSHPRIPLPPERVRNKRVGSC